MGSILLVLPLGGWGMQPCRSSDTVVVEGENAHSSGGVHKLSFLVRFVRPETFSDSNVFSHARAFFFLKGGKRTIVTRSDFLVQQQYCGKVYGTDAMRGWSSQLRWISVVKECVTR
jgi:hypothetical protein